jgi:hypothetical protein
MNINPALFGKPLILVSAPVSTRSGYGDSARDFVHHLLALGKYDVKIWPTSWGMTPTNALNSENEKDRKIIACILTNPNLPKQPDVYITITVPNEFQPIGKYNIGYTAGIETTQASAPWLEGCNRMDLILATSNHSKLVLETTSYDVKDNMGVNKGQLKVTKPIEVMHNCIDPTIYKRIVDEKDIPEAIKTLFNGIPETFGFLFVGHWLQGELGQDRKDVGMLVKIFLETFKNEAPHKQPCLILKTSGGNFSILDREEILNKLNAIKKSVAGDHLPNVYLVHGDFTEPEMNGLMNHKKVKAHISLTKGEGFGMPLLQATMSMKPVIASGWSGQLDFLNPEDAILIGGKLAPVHASAIWKDVIDEGSQWFTADYNMASTAMQAMFKEYDKFIPGAKKLMRANREKFSYEALEKRLEELFAKYVPAIPVELPLALPSLRKIT